MTNADPWPVELHTVLSISSTSKGNLTVVTANLQNPYARLSKVDEAAENRLAARLEGIARLLESAAADIILCQEVGRGDAFRVDEWLAGRLGMSWAYTRANGDAARWGREEGLAILSRFSLAQPAATLLAGGLWRRPALGVVAATPLGEVAFYTAHLSLRPWRNRRQPAALRAWVMATAGGRPAVIGGDFNAPENAPQIAALSKVWRDAFRAIHPQAVGATHALHLFGREVRRQRIDYLFLPMRNEEIRIADCMPLGTLPNHLSDHLPLVARLTIAESGQAMIDHSGVRLPQRG